MAQDKKVDQLLEKIDKVNKENKIDLSSGEDLSIGIMNLISAEEHLYFTYQKTHQEKYLELLNEVRLMRTELLRQIIKEYEGEVWCISKHLLSASMRLIEVGTKELKKGDKKKAEDLFDKAYKLYSLFWALNTDMLKVKDVKKMGSEMTFLDEKGKKKGSASVFDKLGSVLQKALDCCRE
jgi:hypothetical protein